MLSGWAALALATLLIVWAAAPLARTGGPDLGALRLPAEGVARDAGTGGSTTGPRRVPEARRPAPKVLPTAPLDLNRATATELAALPGIGPALAARIVAHREAVGAFPRLEALRGVPGIGPKRYERLAPHLSVREPSPTGTAGDRNSGGPRPPAAEKDGA